MWSVTARRFCACSDRLGNGSGTVTSTGAADGDPDGRTAVGGPACWQPAGTDAAPSMRETTVASALAPLPGGGREARVGAG